MTPLSSDLDEEPVAHHVGHTVGYLIESIDFADPAAVGRVHRDLMLLPGAQAPLTLIWPRLLTTLSTAASPDRALINFARFVQDAPAPADLLTASRR